MILECISAFVVILVTIITIVQWKLSTSLKKLKHFNGPKTVPFFGNALQIPLDSCRIFQKIIEWQKEYQNNIRVFIGPVPLILISDPHCMERILGSTQLIDKSSDYDFLRKWLGDGLLISTGPKWKSRRKIITPAFHFKILEQFIDVFNSSNNIFVKKLSKHVDGEEFDIYPYITLNAMDIICETAMGIPVNAQQNADSDYVVAVRNMCGLVFKRIVSIRGQFDFIFNLTSEGRLQNKSLKILHKLTNDVIASRRKMLSTKNKTTEEMDEFGVKRKLAFLDMLLESTINEQPLSDEDIREEVDTFMFEGHDTVSSAVGFSFYSLAKNPEVQKKAFLELYEIFGDDKTRPATYIDLQNMKYLDLVIKEALRMYPSVPFIARKFKKDTEINGLIYPKDVSIGLLIYTMQRDNKYFYNADQFIPERFLEEHAEKNPYVYVPFSAGPRNCIGQKFALLEMKVTISKVLRHFEILPGNEDLQLTSSIILKSLNGVHVKLKERTYL